MRMLTAGADRCLLARCPCACPQFGNSRTGKYGFARRIFSLIGASQEIEETVIHVERVICLCAFASFIGVAGAAEEKRLNSLVSEWVNIAPVSPGVSCYVVKLDKSGWLYLRLVGGAGSDVGGVTIDGAEVLGGSGETMRFVAAVLTRLTEPTAPRIGAGCFGYIER